MKDKKEILDILNSYHTIKVVDQFADQFETFERNIIFEVNKKRYRIQWHMNICYLYITNNVTIPFYTMELSNTYHHKSKMNLQFYDLEKRICCVIRVE